MPAFAFTRRGCPVHTIPHAAYIQLPVSKVKLVRRSRAEPPLTAISLKYTTLALQFHLAISLDAPMIVVHGSAEPILPEERARRFRLAQEGLVDVVIDTDLHREFYEPFRVGRALWVRSHYQTMRVGELRLGLVDGEVAWATDRKIELDPEIPSATDQLVISKQARTAIDRAQQEAFGKVLGL